MTIVTKYDIGDTVYHTVSGEQGIIVSILISDRGHTEYKVALGIAGFGFCSEKEISKESIYV